MVMTCDVGAMIASSHTMIISATLFTDKFRNAVINYFLLFLFQINTWIILPESVISASTTDSFKNKPDKLWSNQEAKKGTGNRNSINNLG